MRGVMIWIGVALVERFNWVLYIFGAFLVITGLRMLFDRDAKVDFEKNFFMRFCRKMLPLTKDFHGRRFAVRIDGRLMFTPLLLVLIFVDIMDLVFAVDSIPAIFAITTDPFIVFTSNLFAVLGLRSLYFALSGLLERLRYLQHGLVGVLAIIGAKMLLAAVWPAPAWLSLSLVALVLGGAIVASLVSPSTQQENTIDAQQS